MCKRTLRPKDAATLILVRRNGGADEVLMGQRHSRHAFMPDRYVFPGGRVDRADHYIKPVAPLRHAVEEMLTRACTPKRAQALALAAVRETFEETGLLIGRPAPAPRTIAPSWRNFFASGLVPVLDGFDYVGRAITPPYRPRRFNTRFFLVDATDVRGKLAGNGELVDLQWVAIEAARELQIPRITEIVLGHVETLLAHPERHGAVRPTPFYRMVHGRHTMSYE